MVSAYADLSDYQSWTDRQIPLVILERRAPFEG
jgi:hypothetical protein